MTESCKNNEEGDNGNTLKTEWTEATVDPNTRVERKDNYKGSNGIMGTLRTCKC